MTNNDLRDIEKVGVCGQKDESELHHTCPNAKIICWNGLPDLPECIQNDCIPFGGGIGFIKGLFAWAGKYQRSHCGFNPQTSLSEMREFILRVGSDRPIVLGSGRDVAPVWGVGWGNGQRGSVG